MSRDLPVLTECVRRLNVAAHHPVRPAELMEATSLEEGALFTALTNLANDRLIRVQQVVAEELCPDVTAVSPDALRVTGAWPTAETAFDRIIAALEAIAANTEADEDTRSRARKILDSLAGSGKALGVIVAGAAISGQIPGAS